MCNKVESSDPTLGNSLFGAVKLVKNADIDKYKYSGYGISFDVGGRFSFPTGRFGKNVIIFDSKKKDILVLGEATTQTLDDTTLTAEKYYSISFTKLRKKSCLSLHYNRGNSCSFVNGVGIHTFKSKDSEINTIP